MIDNAFVAPKCLKNVAQLLLTASHSCSGGQLIYMPGKCNKLCISETFNFIVIACI